MYPLKILFLLTLLLISKELKKLQLTFFLRCLCLVLRYLFSQLASEKKQLEDISQIKKYALYELLSSVKRQESQLIEYPPIDDPSILYVSYVLNAFEVKESCNKVLAAYSNLLTTQERDAVKQLQLYTNSFFSDLWEFTKITLNDTM